MAVQLETHFSPLMERFAQVEGEAPRYTIIADGDWTLYEAKTHEDTFKTSPAKEAVLAWIRAGIKTDKVGKQIFTHQLILSTGGDAQMATERFAHHLPDDVKPAITLITNTGARLFYYDADLQLQEDSIYTSDCIVGGVCISPEISQKFMHHGVDLLNIFFSELKTNTQLQQEVLLAPYGKGILDSVQNYPEAGFTLEGFQKEGHILYGIHKTLNNCPRIEIRQIGPDQTVQISIIGVFSNLPALQHHAAFQECLAKLNSCPGIIGQNLCVLEISRTSKGTALEYFNINPAYSLGMGDSPEANDKPLSEYKTMPFVSVADNVPNFPIDPSRFHTVGQKVRGTQVFFENLLQAQTAHPNAPFSDVVQIAQHQAKTILK